MQRNSAWIVREGDKFIVRIREDGEVTEKAFDHEQFARSWATGQRMRVETLERASQQQS
ncbi:MULTISPECIES: hypothetical protein [Pseudorhizobium]|jgi:hypothetical protein|uniref:hypothetical protein n=1 Tax=Pseudorhizobium TaxID=1903858 RepID=UPI000B2F3AEB|nr:MULTISPECIES: hypothetical protein [Pseudorhizobium]MBA4784316.1 hypothetical protein [Hyphomicrobiales bacterium]MDY6962660.1 hypothetical protein [Pseudomonadota bacterium]|tara:strand:- start:8738 stop:8914 length:177 start_codon:yes stop_codon:yes gene_type:complete